MKRPHNLHDLAAVAALYRQSTGRLVLGAVLATLVVLAGMALLATSGWFISAAGLAGLSAAAALVFNVFVPGAAIRLLALVRTFGRYAERVVTHDATLAVLAGVREQLFRGWAGPSAARALLHRPARLLFRLTNDVDALAAFYLRLAVPAMAALGATLLAAVLLGALDWRLGLAMLVWLALCGAGVVGVTARRALPVALRRAHALERLRASAADLVGGQADLTMAGRLGAQCDLLARADARLARADAQLHRLATRAGWVHAVGGHLGVAAVLLAAGLLAEQQGLGAPAAALALLTALAALEPFAALRQGAIDAARSLLAARRLAPRLRPDAAPIHAMPPHAAPTPVSSVHVTSVHVTPSDAVPTYPATMHATGNGAAATQQSAPAPAVAPASDAEAGPPPVALSLAAASVIHHGRHQSALAGISLQIYEGERVAIIGASGAGKSTLLALAAGELQPSTGQVSAMPATWLTQRTELFQDSLADNLRLAAPEADAASLWHALHAAGLDATVRSLSQGLDTPLGEGGLGLSGGQARRLALARLLLHPARFWLLDEPTEGLDQATAADVLARLARHADGRTVLIATHKRSEAALADRVLLVERGRLRADLRRGTPAFARALAALRQH